MAKKLARTYSHPSYEDPWECVQDYQRVLEYTGGKPNKGSTAVSSALNLPRSRVRPWMEGSRPDAVRAIMVAEDKGWVNFHRNREIFRGLNVLVAWIFSGGSIIQDNYSPLFVVDNPNQRDLLDITGGILGVEFEFTREGEGMRSDEMSPNKHGTVLGRVLHCLGGPVGDKNEKNPSSIPEYLAEADSIIARDFITVYVINRGTIVPERNGAIQLSEVRSPLFRRSLANLIKRETDSPTSVHKHKVYLPAQTAQIVSEWDKPLADLVE